MAKDAGGREPIDRYNETMQDLHRKLAHVRKSMEKLQTEADYLMDEMRSAEISLIVAAAALNDREKGD